MQMATKRELTAPCGIDCFNCEVQEANITPTTRAYLAQRLGRQPDAVGCPGCRASGGCRLAYKTCPTLECAREHGAEFCSDCTDFPCAKLAPTADSADRYPHNYKVYNLALIKAKGFDAWAETHAADTRQRYYKGRLVVGNGPVLEDITPKA